MKRRSTRFSAGPEACFRLRQRGSGAVAAMATVALWLALPAPAAAQQWFDSYARGLKALREGRAQEAIDHLERAIARRAEPGENLLTYGTNRLEHYHPYLKLAEARLLAGQLEAARSDLARSDRFGVAPQRERDRVRAQIDQAAQRLAAAAVTPPPTTLPPATSPPTVPTPIPTAPPSASPPPTTAAPVKLDRPRLGTLALDSDPRGAVVEIAGRERGRTPVTLSLPAGDHGVTLRKEGTAEQGFVVHIEAERTTTESRQLLALLASGAPTPARPAAVEIRSEPGGASVYLDDEHVGRTDPDSGRLVRRDVTPGAHRLRVALESHQDVVLAITVTTDGPNHFPVTLPPLAATGGFPWAPLLIVAAVLLAGVVGLVLWRRPRSAGLDEEAPTAALVRTPVRRHTAPPEGRRTPTPSLSQDLGLEPFATRVNPSTPPSSTDEWFGDYRLIELLGRGGMATVHKAERGRDVCALKRPLESFLEEPEFVQRFLREAEIGRTLHHPNIIRIFERGDVNGFPYFTMELVLGETLQAFSRRNPALAERSATKIVAQVAEALDYAHLKGVVHRDLKPSNIMVLDEGIVKVMDYGIARSRRLGGITLTGAFLGTPEYVAPETAEGGEADARCDLYSLGVVYYEVLTGAKPFVGETPFATLRKHCTDPPTPPSAIRPSCPKELERIVLKLLEKDPADRYATAEELLIELRDYLNRVA
jgi:hypothetical protein